jgi:hypothetical protein
MLFLMWAREREREREKELSEEEKKTNDFFFEFFFKTTLSCLFLVVFSFLFFHRPSVFLLCISF